MSSTFPIALTPNALTLKILSIAAPIGVLLTLPYFLFRLPEPEPQPKIHSGLSEAVGPDAERLRELYPEDLFEGGGYAELPGGKVKYYLVGGEFNRKLVLIGGLAVPAPIWHKIIKKLSQDFLVLVYDHYGRGYSDAPEVKYTPDFYVNELAQLMQYIGWTKAHIVGVSMGGAIAARFASVFPNLVDAKIAFIAPVGLLQDRDIPLRGKVLAAPVTQWFLTFNFIRRLIIGKSSTTTVKSLGYDALTQEEADDGQKEIAEIMHLQQLALPYHLGALGSTIRYGPLRGQESYYELVGQSQTDLKVLLIWGTADQSVPYAYATEFLKRIPHARLVTVPGGGHDLTISHSELVGGELRDFFW